MTSCAKERLKTYEPLAISKFRKIELTAAGATTLSDAVEAAFTPRRR